MEANRDVEEVKGGNGARLRRRRSERRNEGPKEMWKEEREAKKDVEEVKGRPKENGRSEREAKRELEEVKGRPKEM